MHLKAWIGKVELREIDKEHSKAELGCRIAVAKWAKGYAVQAWSVGLRFELSDTLLGLLFSDP